jgi:hypothetical protein
MTPSKDPNLPSSYLAHAAIPAAVAHLWKKKPGLTIAAAGAGSIVRHYRGKAYNRQMEKNKYKFLRGEQPMDKLSELGFKKSANYQQFLNRAYINNPKGAKNTIKALEAALQSEKSWFARRGIKKEINQINKLMGAVPGFK